MWLSDCRLHLARWDSLRAMTQIVCVHQHQGFLRGKAQGNVP